MELTDVIAHIRLESDLPPTLSEGPIRDAPEDIDDHISSTTSDMYSKKVS